MNTSKPPRRPGHPGSGGGTHTSVELLRGARAGQADAMNRLIERYLPSFRRWAHRRLPVWARDVMNTDDLIQETLLGTVMHIKDFEPRRDGALQAYLHRAMINRIRDEVRKRHRHPLPVTLQSAQPAVDPSPLEMTIFHEAHERYVRALEAAPERDREAIVARIELGQSWDEVARVIGKRSPDAARMAVTRAIKRLATEMARLERTDAEVSE